MPHQTKSITKLASTRIKTLVNVLAIIEDARSILAKLNNEVSGLDAEVSKLQKKLARIIDDYMAMNINHKHTQNY